MNQTPGLLNMFGLYHESKNFQITKPISYQLLILKLNISKRPEGDKVWLEELPVVQSKIEIKIMEPITFWDSKPLFYYIDLVEHLWK